MTAVQHIAFNCRNLRGQEQFYAKHFGFRRARIFNAGKPDEFIMLRLGSVCLELFTAHNPPAAETGREQPIGFKHLAFEVPDMEKAVAALQADGIVTGGIIDCSSILRGMRVCFFKDPDGNQVELMQGYQDQFRE